MIDNMMKERIEININSKKRCMIMSSSFIYSFKKLKIPNYFFGKPLNFSNIIDAEIFKNNIKIIENKMDRKLSVVEQRHTNIIKKVTIENYMEKTVADGMVTNLQGIALAIKVADCESIFLYDSKKKVIANVHSGWKGTVGKIIKNAVNVMAEDYECKPSDIKAFIGPSIGKCHFEVDEDVYMVFKESFKEINIDKYIIFNKNTNKYYIDIAKINKAYLISCGLKRKNIYLANICSVCKCKYIHSYRATKKRNGLNMAVISL